MEQIIKAVMAQTGLSETIAKTAVSAVLSHLKSQLPKPIADQLDMFLGGGSGAAGGSAGDGGGVVGSVLKGLGGMLGGGGDAKK